MWRVAVWSLLLAFSLAGRDRSLRAAEPDALTLQRFLGATGPRLWQYRALRHLEARSERYAKSAWMDVWTEADPSGFRFQVVREEGSRAVRTRVFLPLLEAEREMWAMSSFDRSAFSRDNYDFKAWPAEDGLVPIHVTPRRKDHLLLDGVLFVRVADGELVRAQGRLAKTPSFWTSRIDTVRHYERQAGIRVPVRAETVAKVRLVGVSQFSMSWTYESINGVSVGADPREPIDW